jgi:predicted DsbA family dithiol-disulfide isomerase
MGAMAPMPVDVWSDVICPWCYIGKRRLEAALARFEHRDEVVVTWHSFELDPDAPRTQEGSLAEGLAAKYGMSLEQAHASHAQLTELAAAEGLEYHFDRAQRGNTFDAHRLIHLAAAHDRQDAMKERLMRAYFTEGAAIGDRETLSRLAAEVGIAEAEARAALAGGRYSAEVREDERTGSRIGIQGVPFFVLDRRFGVSGAQPAGVLREALEHAWAAREGAAAA